jgi:RNA polymerase sigma-70 factor (ECF subfamily)
MNLDTTFLTRWAPWAPVADESAWDALYAEQLPRIYNFLRYRVGPTEAEDLAARVFEKAWRHRQRYQRDLGSFTTWLFAIARREAIDHYRRRRPLATLDEAASVSTGETPEDTALRRDQSQRLGRLLARLTDRDRDLISLKFGAELTNREIAKLTKLSESNVGTILHRAIERLRLDWTQGETP